MAREANLGDGADALREWRWRSYLDHLEDLGYDLENGGPREPETPAAYPDPNADRSRLIPSPDRPPAR